MGRRPAMHVLHSTLFSGFNSLRAMFFGCATRPGIFTARSVVKNLTNCAFMNN